jgi:hypothetical protein
MDYFFLIDADKKCALLLKKLTKMVISNEACKIEKGLGKKQQNHLKPTEQVYPLCKE